MFRWVSCFSLLLVIAPLHAQIYRWTDAQGRVHFSERPVQGAEQIEVDPQVIERDAQVRQREQNLRRIMDVRSEERAAEQLKLNEQRNRQRAQCDDLRRQLAQFDKRMFWYDEDANGKRIEVDRKRVEARKAQLTTLVQERC
ncbi:DUF4124 domain-containing protein [Halopseudomonas nanhaiensis]|uniref:DUF4124 domain-containing protein n=1 Tax=Halopseudomonas nanhaiensis TaxID=2830842 RepID=UPI001CBCB255|nr:DUF4124 domain-containing protein [Halopseudomonas nanhaiensis]UAW99319.1 DUF4124 domain-containing protein [Halopseudomonas nanhaiensis]